MWGGAMAGRGGTGGGEGALGNDLLLYGCSFKRKSAHVVSRRELLFLGQTACPLERSSVSASFSHLRPLLVIDLPLELNDLVILPVNHELEHLITGMASGGKESELGGLTQWRK